METMPFTPAHAAAALPLRRARLILSALLVGTMAPDFEYFLRMAPGGGFGHTFAGSFLLSLPLALAVLWIFHALIKVPLVQLFPDAIRLRLGPQMGPFRFGGPGRFMLIVVSALVGIATHIAWDSFTHRHTWPYRHFHFLRQRLPVPVLGSVAVVKALQHVSTIAGLLLVAAWVFRWYRTTEPRRTARGTPLAASRRWLVAGSIAILATFGGVLRVAMIRDSHLHSTTWEIAIGDGVVTLISLAWWMLVAYGAFVSLRRSSRLEA